MPIDADALTQQLLDVLKNRNAEISRELELNIETIAALERRLKLESPLSKRPVAATSNGNQKELDLKVLAFEPNVFFGLTQKAAAIKLLKWLEQPLKINDMLTVLENSGYHFKAQNPYRILWKTLNEADEIQKQGSLYGLKEWKDRHAQESPQIPAEESAIFREVVNGEVVESKIAFRSEDHG